MASSLIKVWTFLGLLVVICNAQPPSNIYDALSPNGCGQFLAILNKCGLILRSQYRENMRWTVFAPNDTAFNTLPPSKLSALLSMTQEESENFVKSFTVNRDLLTTHFRDTQPERTLSSYNTYIFFKKKPRRAGNSASGVEGPLEYYANGAMIWKPNIQAGYGVIHVIDRVLTLPSDMSILGYISLPGQPDTAFYREVLSKIISSNYQDTVEPLNSYKYLTVFVPTEAALAKIPRDKLQNLLSNPETLNQVARQHMIRDEVIFTSFVYHNDGFNSMGRGQVIFRTSKAREAVYVNSGGVTAQITQGNLTCTNGALHFIDTLLGYVYNTAMEEIQISPETQRFEDLLQLVRNDLHNNMVSPSGVTLFVPINSAFDSLPSFYNYRTNQSFINREIELSLVEQGREQSVTKVNGDYEARETWTSQYYRRPIIVYSQGNESWIESGYVKARVVRPDVAVKNGFVHFIDAVPGAPSRDVPNTIFCQDWLIKSSFQLTVTGLNDYMRDLRLDRPAPCTLGGGVRASPDVFNGKSSPVSSVCPGTPGSCQFTIFIPNGTAINFFENQEAGKYIQQNPSRWRYVLARHITRQVLYMDQTAIGQERSYQALNGDTVRFRRVTERYTYVYFRGRQAQVLHSDLGGTNGVVHIIDNVLFDSDDLYRDNFGWGSGIASAPVGHVVSSAALFLWCFAVLSHRLMMSI